MFAGALMVLMISVLACFLSSCEKEESYGIPEITNIRVTDPEQANISLTSGNMGQMIVIQGKNLKSTIQIFFNNVEAFFIPTLVTDNNIIVNIPNDFPTEINNQIRVITLGGEAIYNFTVEIPAPVITSFPLEWVNEGGILTIKGQYFYSVESVVFTGGAEGTIVSQAPNEMQVLVPAGAENGPVTVNALAGSGVSKIWFRDNRNIQVDFNTDWICTWTDASLIIKYPDDLPPGFPVEPINGPFYYFKADFGDGMWWDNNTVIPGYCHATWVTGNPANFALAFEMWVGAAWNDNWWEIEVGGKHYEWRGYEELGGEAKKLENTGWMTVKIPLERWNITDGSFALGRFGSYKAATAQKFEFAIDNIRIVPIN